jgi:hypothetical protein
MEDITTAYFCMFVRPYSSILEMTLGRMLSDRGTDDGMEFLVEFPGVTTWVTMDDIILPCAPVQCRLLPSEKATDAA